MHAEEQPSAIHDRQRRSKSPFQISDFPLVSRNSLKGYDPFLEFLNFLAQASLHAVHRQTPQEIMVRQVAFFHGRSRDARESHTDRMKRRLDSPEGRARYGQRFATVEPVFGNLRYNKGLDRFTLRGRVKVDAQWKLFCLVHNIEKLAHLGYAA